MNLSALDMDSVKINNVTVSRLLLVTHGLENCVRQRVVQAKTQHVTNMGHVMQDCRNVHVTLAGQGMTVTNPYAPETAQVMESVNQQASAVVYETGLEMTAQFLVTMEAMMAPIDVSATHHVSQESAVTWSAPPMAHAIPTTDVNVTSTRDTRELTVKIQNAQAGLITVWTMELVT